MKLIQTGDQIEIKNGGIGQLLTACTTLVTGIGIAIVLFGGFITQEDGSKPASYLGFIGVLFVIFGFFFARSAQNKNILIQKAGDTTITASRIIGGSHTQQSFPTANIVGVLLATYMQNSGGSSEGNNTNNRSSDISLRLNNNDLVQVASKSSNGGGFSFNGMNLSNLIQKAPLSKEAQQLAAFLGVPLDAQDNSSLASAVHSVVNAFKQEVNPQQPVLGNQNSTTTLETKQAATIQPTIPAPPVILPPQPSAIISPTEPQPVKPKDNQ